VAPVNPRRTVGWLEGAGWVIGPPLPDGVLEMLQLVGYKADYLPPKFINGARIKGSGGFQITNNMGACMAHVALNADFETWRTALGRVLDYNRLPQPQETTP